MSSAEVRVNKSAEIHMIETVDSELGASDSKADNPEGAKRQW